MTYTATLSSKGQIVIPKPIRDKLKLSPAVRLTFTILDDGFQVKSAPELKDFYGVLKGVKLKTHMSDDELVIQSILKKHKNKSQNK